MNVLQFRGRRFVCFRFTSDDIVVYDQVFMTDAVLTVSMASQLGFELAVLLCTDVSGEGPFRGRNGIPVRHVAT